MIDTVSTLLINNNHWIYFKFKRKLSNFFSFLRKFFISKRQNKNLKIIHVLTVPMNEFLIYIRNHSVVFSHLDFHVNTGVMCS
jgi:hypothetical protein